MGFAKKRVGKDGKPRYTAVYVDLHGSERSAGDPRQREGRRPGLVAELIGDESPHGFGIAEPRERAGSRPGQRPTR